MICPKCGNECGKNNFCSKCGTRIIRTCSNCHRVLLEDEVFCPECGTENRERKETKNKEKNFNVGSVGLILTVVLSVLNVVKLAAIHGSFRVFLNGFFYHIPFSWICTGYIVTYFLLICFSVLFRVVKKARWCGIVSIVLAVLISAGAGLGFSSLIIIAGTIVSYCYPRFAYEKN